MKFRSACSLFVLLLLLLVSIVVASTSHSVSGPHIADVNLLLPPKMTYPVEYMLQGSGGCFKWTWDHHDILAVQPEYNASSHCSTSARVKSIAAYSGRKETAIYATDVQTGLVIRCKVYIDLFSRIQIFHSSVKLDLDGLATLRVRAFDSEDNIFSSLVGLQFDWKLMSENGNSNHHLEYIQLKDSPLTDCGGLCGDLETQIKLEDIGSCSDLFVVKGTSIGHETVSVHLDEPGVQDVSDKIILTVAEAMFLDPPSPVLVLIGASVKYSLKVIRGRIPQVVALPSPYHQWYVLNSSVAVVDKLMGVAQALRIGITTVSVEDNRVTGHSQMSSFHVVLPDTLVLYISPLFDSGEHVEDFYSSPSVSRWYVVSDRQYLVQMKVYSQGPGAREILITEKDNIKVQYNQLGPWMISDVLDDIAAKSGWKNSKILKAVSPGSERLTASLAYSNGQPDTKEVIKVVQEIIVCDSVKFNLEFDHNGDQRILLPWVPAISQEAELKAIGGCVKESSDYKWFSSDITTVSISTSGVIEAKKPGKATIRVVSTFDPNNFDEVIVEVSTPSSLIMLPNLPVETVVGSHLQAAVTMKASDGSYFYRCDAFSSLVSWKVGSDSFISVNGTNDKASLDTLSDRLISSSVYGPPCACISLYALASGHGVLHASVSTEYHHFDHTHHGTIKLKTSTRLAAYPPLIVVQAGDGNQFGGYWFNYSLRQTQNQLYNLENVFLVPESQLNVTLLGGPEQWDKDIHFIEVVELTGKEHTGSKDGLLVHSVSAVTGLYQIYCRSLGIFQLLFKRGNLVGNDHMLPAVAEVTLSVACSFPSSIAILADQPVNDPEAISTAVKFDRSPGKVRATPITVSNGRTIRMAAVGFTDSGKAFANSSSLSLGWDLVNCEDVAFWNDDITPEFSVSNWERFLVLRNTSGMCDVRASASLPTTMQAYRSLPHIKTSDFPLVDAVRLHLVSNLKLSPDFSLVFFHPNAKVNLSIVGGSCFLDSVVNDSRVAELIQPADGLGCIQLILTPRGLGKTVVTVTDIGLTPPLAASAVVQVSDVDWIRINSPDDISIMEGGSQSFELVAGIDDGSVFDSSQLAYMNVQLHVENHIVDLTNDGDISSLGAKFVIKAKYLGFTSIYVSARQQSGREVHSKAVKVEVYEAPRIFPDDIFLVPGAFFMLTLKGGPTKGAFIEYGTVDNSTATIHESTGKLAAISPGNTTLIAIIYGSRDKDSVICQAYGKVRVGVPSSALLSVQSQQLDIGREMPIFPSLSEGDLFSFYELCSSYRWIVEDDKVINLFASGHPNTHEPETCILSATSSDDDEPSFIKLLSGRSAGITKVAISFSCEFATARFSQSKTYNASVSLTVVPALPLALGAPLTWILPPQYITTSLLPISQHPLNELDMQSQKRTIVYSLLKTCRMRTDDFGDDGLAIHGDKIRTGASNSVTCITVEDRSTRKTEIASCIKVAELAQVRIKGHEQPFRKIDIPIGGELDFNVSYYDTLGNPFHEAYNVAVYNAYTNYPDVVSINDTSNIEGKIHIKGVNRGKALVQLSANLGQLKTDYILVSVGARLFPQNPVLQLGSNLNFGIEGLNNDSPGSWTSANETVVHVDRHSGKARAVGAGTTQVFYTCSEGKLQTTITVQKGHIIIVETPNKTLTNVPFPSKGYYFSVDLRGAKDQKYDVDPHNEVLFNCWVDPPSVGYTKPWIDLESGKSFCLFFPYSPEHLVHSMPKPTNIRPDISVTIGASLREAGHVSGNASALFVGGFSVLETGKLNFGPNHNTSIITILGNTDVEVQWQDHDAIMVNLIFKESLGIGGRAQYEIKVLKSKKFKDKILIKLQANGQLVEVDVEYEPPVEPASKSTFFSLPWTAAVLTLVVLAWTLMILFIMERPGNRSRQAPSTPSIAAPVTPDRRSPVTLANGHSPRTPPPFVDYVRRTIDETPYYRRERRTLNPQNTY